VSALALKWADFDWSSSRLQIERAIVCQNVDEVKTEESGKQMPISEELLAELKAWHYSTAFPEPTDWVFASPVQLGRLLWSYHQIWRMYQKAAHAAGIGSLGTHVLRHTIGLGSALSVLHLRCSNDSCGTRISARQCSTEIRSPIRWSKPIRKS
jgi:integrase